MKSLYLIISIVVIVAVIYVIGMNFLNSLVGYDGEVTYQHTNQMVEEAKQEMLSSGGKIALVAPQMSIWNKGETGIFTILIRNDETEGQSYSTKVILSMKNGKDADPMLVDDWFTYYKSNFLQPQEIEETQLVVQTPHISETGTYLFRVIVCKGVIDCTLNSPSLYGEDSFAIELI